MFTSLRRWLAPLAAVALATGVVAVASPAQAAGTVTAGGTSVVEQGTATSAVVLPKPSGVVNGDALVATFTVDLAPSVTPPTGWSAIASPLSIGTGARLFSYLHVVTDAGSEPASYSFGLSSAQKWGGVLAGFHNVDPVNPLDTTVSTAVDATYTHASLAVPSITTNTVGAMVLTGVGADRRDAMFSLSSGIVVGQAHDGQGTALARSDALTWAGATGAANWSMVANTGAAGWMTALRPGAGTPPSPASATITGTTPGDGQVVVDFTVNPGTQNVTGVRACRDGNDTTGAGPWCGDLAATATSITFDKLVNGNTYTFTIDPLVDGTPTGSPAAATATPTDGTVTPPTGTTAAVTLTPGDGTITADWSLTVGTDGADGAILSRDGTDTTGAGPWSSTVQAGTSGTLTFDKLVNDTAYQITVQPTAAGSPVGTPVTETATPTTGTPPPPAAECGDGVDNDGDGLTDYPADPGCTSSSDDDEVDPAAPAQCADGVDNDGDGLVDMDDPGCTGTSDGDETDPVAPVAPVAGFTSSPSSGTAPLVVQFTDTSTGNPTSWAWDFGDGGTSASQSPSHTYADAGTYTATLTVTNGGGSDSASHTVTVGAAPATEDVSKVLVIVEENHSLAEAQAGMPYLNGLAQQYAYGDQFFAITHPSLPNYLAIAGGSTFGVTDDNEPSSHPLSGASVFGQALSAGLTAHTYAESMPGNCTLTGNVTNGYAVKHNPWAYFTDSAERSACQSYDTPSGNFLTDAANSQLANVTMLIPNKCNDAHDCSLGTADNWLQGVLPTVLSSDDFTSGRLAVVVTADEDDGTAGNKILTAVLHKSLDGAHQVVHSTLNLYSLSAMLSQVSGSAPLRNAAGAADMASAFGLTITPGGSQPPAAACADSIDNDGDGVTDYPADPGCTSATDDDESDPAPPGTQPNGPSGSWTLAFDDEFNGTSIDTSKWATNWYGEGGSMNGVGTYARNVSEHDGAAYLQLESTSAGALIHTDISGGYRLPVGSYTEARIYFPGPSSTSLSNWAAWWASAAASDGWPSSGEHDIAEILSGTLTVNYHSPSGAHNQGAVSGFAPGNSWHTYGLYRGAGFADVYWDGVLVKHYTTDDSGRPEILILNVGNGSNDAFGQAGAMRVDYVRAWSPS